MEPSGTYTKIRTFVLEWAKAGSMAEIAAKVGMTERAASNKAGYLKRQGVIMKNMPFSKRIPKTNDEKLSQHEYECLRRLSRGLPEAESPSNAAPMMMKDERFLCRLLDSGAARKLRGDIFFKDALFFWAIPKLSLKDSIGLISDRLADIEGVAPVRCAGRDVSDGDIRALQRLHEWLQERFEVQLRLMRAA